MDRRLSTIAAQIENGLGLADVGTDHGFLPVHLARHGYTGNLYASDINEGPLRTAIDNAEHRRLLELAAKNIAVISMHTNLDIAEGGVNDVLIRALGAEPECALDADGCGRVGTLPEEKDMESFLKECKAALKVKGLRYYSAGRPVHRLAVMGGSGGDCVDDAYAKGCDTYVTADIKYHQFLHAAELGINLIDADHFCTEDPVMYSLRDKLTARFPEAEFTVSAVHHQIIDFI